MYNSSSHINFGFYHEFNWWNLQLHERREYVFMVLQEYSIITRP